MSEITKPIILDETGKEIVAAILSTDVAQARIAEINTAAEAAKDDVLASIPEDYTNLVEDVSQLSEDINDIQDARLYPIYTLGMIKANGTSGGSTACFRTPHLNLARISRLEIADDCTAVVSLYDSENASIVQKQNLTGVFDIKTWAAQYPTATSLRFHVGKQDGTDLSDVTDVDAMAQLVANMGFSDCDMELESRVKNIIASDLNDEGLWSNRAISTTTGESSTSLNRISTNNFLSNEISLIKVASGYRVWVYAWSTHGGYVGLLQNDGTFAKSDAAIASNTSAIDMDALRNIHPDYKYRLVVLKGSIEISTAEYSALKFYNALYRNIEASNAAAPFAGKKIVCFGDSIIGNWDGDTSTPYGVAVRTGATVYNAGFGGSHMSERDLTSRGAFSVCAISDAVTTGNWTNQDATAADYGDIYVSHLSTLKSINFSEVFGVVIHAGTNDFAAGKTFDNPENAYDTATVCGALRYSIRALLQAFPHLRIYVSLPIYRRFEVEGEYIYSGEYAMSGGTLEALGVAMTDAAKALNIPIIDGYHDLGINSANFGSYYADGTHPNEDGRIRLGNLIGAKMVACT